MDFLERWFGIAPDGGSGALEMLLLELLVGLLVAVVWWRNRHRPSLRLSTWRARLAHRATLRDRGAELRDTE